MQRSKLIIVLIFSLLQVVMSIAVADEKPTAKQLHVDSPIKNLHDAIYHSVIPVSLRHSDYKPEVITPHDVYRVMMNTNLIADAILQKMKIDKWQTLPSLEESISTMVTYQLHLAVIELLHHYELDLKMHPIPIIASSPIKYYPADVMFLSRLVNQRMQEIAKRLNVGKPLPRDLKDYPRYHSAHDVYRVTLLFYMKLLAFTGYEKITSDQTYSQIFRARGELKNIVFHQISQIKDVNNKRILAASLYGASPYGGKPLQEVTTDKTVDDVFQGCLSIRKLMYPLLIRAGLKPLPLPHFKKDYKPESVDIFVQSQIIIAELSEWKRVLGVGSSTPVTVQFKDKTFKDVYKVIVNIEFILDKI